MILWLNLMKVLLYNGFFNYFYWTSTTPFDSPPSTLLKNFYLSSTKARCTAGPYFASNKGAGHFCWQAEHVPWNCNCFAKEEVIFWEGLSSISSKQPEFPRTQFEEVCINFFEPP